MEHSSTMTRTHTHSDTRVGKQGWSDGYREREREFRRVLQRAVVIAAEKLSVASWCFHRGVRLLPDGETPRPSRSVAACGHIKDHTPWSQVIRHVFRQSQSRKESGCYSSLYSSPPSLSPSLSLSWVGGYRGIGGCWVWVQGSHLVSLLPARAAGGV